jgi:hypothetical protein
MNFYVHIFQFRHNISPYFSSLNNEFVVCYKGNYFKYDYVNSLTKKCIEYNGIRFHPHPNQDPKEVNWCVFHPNLTVKEARLYEKLKYTALEKRGYNILTVWDYETQKDYQSIINKCIKFILE